MFISLCNRWFAGTDKIHESGFHLLALVLLLPSRDPLKEEERKGQEQEDGNR